jgi:hypothetical protein
MNTSEVIMNAKWAPVNMSEICRAAAKRYRQDFIDYKNNVRRWEFMRTAYMLKEDYPAVRNANAEIDMTYRQIHSLLEDYRYMWNKAVGV